MHSKGQAKEVKDPYICLHKVEKICLGKDYLKPQRQCVASEYLWKLQTRYGKDFLCLIILHNKIFMIDT